MNILVTTITTIIYMITCTPTVNTSTICTTEKKNDVRWEKKMGRLDDFTGNDWLYYKGLYGITLWFHHYKKYQSVDTIISLFSLSILTYCLDNRCLSKDKWIQFTENKWNLTSITNPTRMNTQRIIASKAIGWTILTVWITWWTTCFIREISALWITITTATIANAMSWSTFESTIRTWTCNYNDDIFSNNLWLIIRQQSLTTITRFIRSIAITTIIIMIASPKYRMKVLISRFNLNNTPSFRNASTIITSEFIFTTFSID